MIYSYLSMFNEIQCFLLRHFNFKAFMTRWKHFHVKFQAIENLNYVLEYNEVLFHVKEFSDAVNFHEVKVANNSYLL